MKTKAFKNDDGHELIVAVNGSNIEVHTNNKQVIDYEFHVDDMRLLDYLMAQASHIWKDFEPKLADSLRSDYFEFYDRKTDNNGYLRVSRNRIYFESPSEETTLLYRFTKLKLEGFMYDLQKT